ncbi:Uncharacterized protein TCM_022694 [Theobroma cacao]|uniref:Uncharacterized protein n=1 Tax=Theobroma cacao TaxID=3641 RepID=A0A061EV94_THECC|nr:Uncharacterized protein TCM_022694 [Theobroma cacao]
MQTNSPTVSVIFLNVKMRGTPYHARHVYLFLTTMLSFHSLIFSNHSCSQVQPESFMASKNTAIAECYQVDST